MRSMTVDMITCLNMSRNDSTADFDFVDFATCDEKTAPTHRSFSGLEPHLRGDKVIII